MTRLARLLLSCALLATVGSAAAASEEPAYTVVRAEGAFELRAYAPYLVAETTVAAAGEAAGDVGFSRLFAYITGANRPGADIAMTAPVMQAPTDAGVDIAMTVPVTDTRVDAGQVVAFVVPAQYTLATVPQPTDPAVRIRAVPAGRVAAVRFAGYWTEAAFATQEAALRGFIGRAGLKAAGPPRLARYDSPFIPPAARRNEILIPVE
jgi:hypothetical protein